MKRKKQFTVEVRAQDVTFDDKADEWKAYSATYRGLASIPLKVTAWVVAGAPSFENVRVAPASSIAANAAEATANKLWDTIDNISIRNRSAYKVTVKHNSGLSSIRWQPTFWDKALNSGSGGFQANSKLDAINILDLDTDPADPGCVYVYRTGTDAYNTTTAKRSVVFGLMDPLTNVSDSTPRMAVTVDLGSRRKTSTGQTITQGKNYLVWNWEQAAGASLVSDGVFVTDPSYYEANGTTFKPSLRYTVFEAKKNRYRLQFRDNSAYRS